MTPSPTTPLPRVLLLTSSFPRFSGDPMVAFMERFVEHLGLPCVVVAPGGPGISDLGMCGSTRIRRFVYWLPRRHQRIAYGDGILDNLRQRPLLALQLPLFFLRFAAHAVREARDCEVIEAHWALPAGLVGLLASWISGTPLVLVLHSGDVHLLHRLPGGRLLARALYKHCRAVIATSGFIRTLFSELLPHGWRELALEAIEVLPMGVDVDHAEEPPPAAAPAQRPLRRVVYLGRLVPVKGLDVLIKALAGIPEVLLEIAGEGCCRESFESLSKALGVAVRFHGALSEPEKRRVLARADVVVVPSVVLDGGRTDSLPVVLLEGLAAGKPVVGTAVGGIPDVLRHDVNGLVVPPGDAAALQAAVLRALEEPGLASRLGHAGRATAEAYAWRRLGPAHRHVLVQAFDAGAPAYVSGLALEER